jgi:hypothetical protein
VCSSVSMLHSRSSDRMFFICLFGRPGKSRLDRSLAVTTATPLERCWCMISHVESPSII